MSSDNSGKGKPKQNNTMKALLHTDTLSCATRLSVSLNLEWWESILFSRGYSGSCSDFNTGQRNKILWLSICACCQLHQTLRLLCLSSIKALIGRLWHAEVCPLFVAHGFWLGGQRSGLALTTWLGGCCRTEEKTFIKSLAGEPFLALVPPRITLASIIKWWWDWDVLWEDRNRGR